MVFFILEEEFKQIIDKYIVDGKLLIPKTQLAKKFKITVNTLHKYMRKYGYQKHINDPPIQLENSRTGRPRKLIPNEYGKIIHKTKPEEKKEVVSDSEMDDFFKDILD